MEEPHLTIKESQESIPSSESKSQSSENDSNEENDKMEIENKSKRHSEERKYDSSPIKSLKSSGSPFTNSRSPMDNEDDEYVN